MSISARTRLPELMDDPALEPRRHAEALRGLARINRWSGSVRILWGPLRMLARRRGGRTLRVLDLATGAGDLPIGLWRRAQRAGLPLELAACDASPRAVAYARESAARTGAAIRFFEMDALTGDVPDEYDVVISSLFLHHLDEEDAVRLLRRMGTHARQMVLVNDLCRNLRGLALAYVAPQVLCRSPVVHTDAVLSVRAAYTPDEVRGLAQRAGLDGAVVGPRWPARLLLRWQRP